MSEQQNTPLQNEEIVVSNIKLVDKGKEPNTWKEYAVTTEPNVKGIKYSIPIKKADGTATKAYETLKEKKSEWEDKFIDGQTINLEVGFSEKVNKWEFKGATGETRYRTIRFFEEVEGSEPVGAQPSIEDDDFPV